MGRIQEEISNIIDDIGVVCLLELIEDEMTTRADAMMEDSNKDGPASRCWRKMASHVHQCTEKIERDANE